MSGSDYLVMDDPSINAESRASTIVILTTVFSLLSFIAVSLRLYTRLGLLHRIGLDDHVIVFAEVLALLHSLGTGMEAHHGLGRHQWTLSPEDTLKQQQWLYFVVIDYNVVLFAIKVSFLLQYRRLFVGQCELQVCKWALVFIAIWGPAQVALIAMSCLPLSSIVPAMKDRCLPTTPIWYLGSSTIIVTDFLIFCIPLRSLIKLNVAGRGQKVILLLIFSIGFFECIIGLIRIPTISLRTVSNDNTWTGLTTAAWSIVEVHMAIVCSCLATLRPLLRHLFPSLDPSGSGNRPYRLNEIEVSRPSKRKPLQQRTLDTMGMPEFTTTETELRLPEEAGSTRKIYPEGRMDGCEGSSERLDDHSCSTIELRETHYVPRREGG